MSKKPPAYVLDDQIGFVLRRATQRHLGIFAEAIPGLTPTQFAALAKLAELGPMSQNQLGRATAMDGATIKGVVGRLMRVGLVRTDADPADRRRLTVRLTEKGEGMFAGLTALALSVSDRTLAPLTADERAQICALLQRIC